MKMDIVHERIRPGRPLQKRRCRRRYRAPARADKEVAPQSRTWSEVSTREVIGNANHPALQWDICVHGRQGWRFRLRDSINLIVSLSDSAVKPYPIPLSTLIPKNFAPE